MDSLIDARWQGSGPLRTLITTNLVSSELPVRIASRLGDTTLGVAVPIQATDWRRGYGAVH
jgi:hypothetical protein